MISTTQSTNYLSLAGALVVIFAYFNIEIGVNELAILIGATVTIIGSLLNFYHRYKKGGITFIGFRKEEQNYNNISLSEK